LHPNMTAMNNVTVNFEAFPSTTFEIPYRQLLSFLALKPIQHNRVDPPSANIGKLIFRTFAQTGW
ncbi:MAG TPA: hypothetical protein VJ508_18175, partial [Saprospiraceae bacterium]|nr:hypothetical protein [Saprospiraceae bacterium]